MSAMLPDCRPMWRNSRQSLWAAALLLAVSCGVSVIICKQLLTFNGSSAIIWFADAVAIAFLYRFPPRDWPILVGTFFCISVLASLSMSLPIGVALLYGVASLVEVFTATLLLRHYLPGGNHFDSLGRWTGFTVAGALLPPLGSAGIGAAVASLYTGISYWIILPAWYLADAAGIMLVLPLALNCNAESFKALRSGALLARFVMVSVVVIAIIFLILELVLLPFVFVSLPLIWAATRLPLLQTLALIFVTVLLLTSYYVGIDTHANPSVAPAPGEQTGASLLLQILAAAIPAYVMAVYTNIERKRNARIVEMESSFRAAVEKSPIGMVLVSLDNVILRANRSFCDFLQYAEDELPGRGVADITYWEDRKQSDDLHRGLVRGEIETLETKKRYLRKNGEFVWGHVCGSLARGIDGEPLYAIVQVEDIDLSERGEARPETELAHPAQMSADNL